MINRVLTPMIILSMTSCGEPSKPVRTEEQQEKTIIYQIPIRLFGNTNAENKFYGSITENGAGKFNDIDDKALTAVEKMGITHIWYTGVIEHATMTDYSAYGIAVDDPDVVKGRAGSPFAIKDYYDVDPDLAVDVDLRMKEFEQLIERTHKNGMKVIIDFVPNHVARSYKSDAKPAGVGDLGDDDDKTLAFSPDNNFYYLPGKSFVVPAGYNPGGDDFSVPLKDGKFDETPAKATGNDVFSETPSIHDWFETVKLNYGVDYLDGRKEYFDPIPDTWNKMVDILLFWAGKGVDGFRCDMCEMVPVKFWDYAVTRVKEQRPDILFVGEAYNGNDYEKYVHQARFDILYDKVGLYDTLKAVAQGRRNTESIISALENPDVCNIRKHMLHFVENHDEQRIASPDFVGSPERGKSMMMISAAATQGPVMVYFGQEVGVKAEGSEGFGGDDGRTTIFDYGSVPEFRAWVNDKKYDGGGLTTEQKALREFYVNLLNVCKSEKAIVSGEIYQVQHLYRNRQGYDFDRCFSFARHADNDLIISVNSFTENVIDASLFVPDELAEKVNIDPSGRYEISDLSDSTYKSEIKGSELTCGFETNIPPFSGRLLKIRKL